MRNADALPEFVKGQRLTADDMNALRRGAARVVAGLPGGFDADSGAMLQRRALVRDLIPFKNAAGEEVPRGGIMQWTGPATINGQPGVEIGKPNSDWPGKYLVCLFDDIADGSYGWATELNERDYCLYDDSYGPPSFGQTWGPVEGEWHLVQGGYGFYCMGENDDDATLAKFTQHVPQMLWGEATDSVAEEGVEDVLLFDSNFADVLGIYARSCVNKGVEINTTNRGVSVAIIAGRPVMAAFACPATES